MEKILYKLIDAIDLHLVKARKDNPFESIIGSYMRYGTKQIGIVFKSSGCELEIYDTVKGTFLDNVAFYCETRVVSWNDIEVDETTDEWQSNGFANEWDYNNWKYN